MLVVVVICMGIWCVVVGWVVDDLVFWIYDVGVDFVVLCGYWCEW